MRQLPKIIVIVGPTSTGKSSAGVWLAKKLGGEIVSCDSRQVYKELNLLSGKVTKKEMDGVPHHLLDIASVKRLFSVSTFEKKGVQTIEHILKKGVVPILVGGTGLYVDALLYENTSAPVGPNLALRKKLEKKTLAQLALLLKKKDPSRYKTIDLNNKVRLVRALEIIEALGHVPNRDLEPRYNACIVVLDTNDAMLKKKIYTRLKERIRRGMVREAKKIHHGGISWKRFQTLGLDASYTAEHVTKKTNGDEYIHTLTSAIWKYVKRQRTWFKKYTNATYIDPLMPNWKNKLLATTNAFIQKENSRTKAGKK